VGRVAVVPLIRAHRAAAWIAGWCLGTVANRIIIIWLYTATGRSVFAAALYHTTLNMSWQLFSNRGSHYDPRVSGVVTAAVTAIVMGVRVLHRPVNVVDHPRRANSSTAVTEPNVRHR
jgi:hypothetical protein